MRSQCASEAAPRLGGLGPSSPNPYTMMMSPEVQENSPRGGRTVGDREGGVPT